MHLEPPVQTFSHIPPAGPAPSCNIASHLPSMARRFPFKRAVVVPAGRDSAGRVTYAQLTFAQLDELSNRYAAGLERIGITRGMRTMLMVKPSLEFFALVFALFKVGTVLVLIDPGLDRKAVLTCLKEVEPEAFIGIPAAHLARILFPRVFRTVRVHVTVGRRFGWGGYDLHDLHGIGPAPSYIMAPTDPEEVAAILFTSGSTGIPKGAIYTHGNFDAQVRLLQTTFQFGPDEIDLCTFPLFALFDPALGMTAVVPDMDARFPGRADPAKLLEAITDHGTTQMFGSPALLERLSRHGEAHGLIMPSMKRILCAGAPVQASMLERMARMLPEGAQVFTPYGATESLPVCNMGSQEILTETRQRTAGGEGICVGKPVSEMCLRVIRISDDPIDRWSDDLVVSQGQIGELTVKGPVVTRGYYARPEQTRLAKIQDADQVVHRMGDVGWVDEQGRVWMCGRKSHRVVTQHGTLFTIPCEAIFNQHPLVRKSALVGVGDRPTQRPALVVELEPKAQPDKARLRQELLELGAGHQLTETIRSILFYPQALPVDVRHNAKIAREKLAVWAAQQPDV